MPRHVVVAFVTLGSALAGCSLLDDSLRVMRCESDAECAQLVSDDPDCLVFRCMSARCAPVVRDDDGDGAGRADCVDRYCTDATGTCAARDCDDGDPTVRPGATEVCNGVDDDCNGLLDGPDEDDDGDGHADACAGARANDCDDDDPTTYVGAPERCDGYDNDCFIGGAPRLTGGRVPEPGEDRDGDGHAPPDAACDEGPFPRDDCDDSRDDVHPGATERCDGADNDCNGIPDDARTGAPGTSCLPIDLTTGDAHSCVRTADLGIVCWGAADFRLAASGLDERTAVVAGTERLSGDGRYLDVAAGQEGTCAVLEGGDVRCWGAPSLVSPELPPLARGEPRLARVVGVTGATRVVAGQHHACALTPDGVMCWGLNPNGAVDGEVGRSTPVTPTVIPGTEGATQVDTSFTHSCAVTGGRVRCWGDPAAGALGAIPPGGARSVEVPAIDDAVEVAVGRCFTCVRRSDASVWCFGDAQYEDDAVIDGPCAGPAATTPRAVNVTDAVSIDAYAVHACAALASGEVRCWGNNTTRQLGEGTPFDASHPREGFDRPEGDPAQVVGVAGAIRVATGTWHSCALLPDGVRCWGRQARHRLGNGRHGDAVVDQPRPYALPVSVIRGPVQLAASARATCLRMPDLSLRCVGAAVAGGAPGCFASPWRSEEWPAVLDVQMSGGALCAVTGRLAPDEGGIVDRVIRCAGSPLSDTFVQAAGPGGVVPFAGEPVAVSVGARHACALDRAGDVHCFGVHDSGQLGTTAPVTEQCETLSGTNPCSRVPLPVALDARATALAAGANHTCALLEGGRVACWGSNSVGQLGRSPITNVADVGLVEGLPGDDPVVAIAAVVTTTCAVLRSGETWCWGIMPVRGELGAWPRRIEQLGSARQVAPFARAGAAVGICARLVGGRVHCIGRNPDGQLGGLAPVCTTPPAGCPDETAGSLFDDAVDLACGAAHCCATRGSGQVVCWGDRTYGQCGDGVAGPSAYGTASTVDLVAYDAGSVPACESP